jgi:hypothetical protein
METERIAITEDQLRISNKIHKYIDKAIKSWVDNNNTRGMVADKSHYYYTQAEREAKKMIGLKSIHNPNFVLINVELDCGVGLYPTFEMTYQYEGEEKQHYTAYTPDQFFKTINGFWK